MWEDAHHTVLRRYRSIYPLNTEAGTERGSSRPGLPKPVQFCGAIEPVFTRSGKQEFVGVTCHILSALMWPKPSWTLRCLWGALGCPQRCQRHRAARGPAAGPPPHPDRAGSHRGPGACRRGRIGGGGPACRGRQPAARLRCHTRHRQLAKTDAWDARTLTHVADVIRPTPRRKRCASSWGAAGN